jgi:hypothetical protein
MSAYTGIMVFLCCQCAVFGSGIQSDPIADEIALLIKETVDCRIIIASDEPLEYMHPNDLVPVEIYYHSLCVKNRKFCPKTPKPDPRPVHCLRVVVVVQNEKAFVQDWKRASERPNPKELAPLFTTVLWDFGLDYRYSFGRLAYYLLSLPAGKSRVRQEITTSQSSRENSLNLYAVDLSKNGASEYYFICQYCNPTCESQRVQNINITRKIAYNETVNSEIIRSSITKERDWAVRSDFETYMGASENEDTEFESQFKKIAKSNPFRIRPENISQHMGWFGAYTLLNRMNERNNKTWGDKPYACKMSSVFYKESGGQSDLAHPGNTLIWTGSETFGFLTCHYENTLDFSFYVTPFSVATWFGILLSAVIMNIAFVAFETLKNVRTGLQFAFCRFTLSAALNSSYTPPTWMTKKLFYRIIMVCWFGATLLLNNLYTSKAITGVTSPLPKRTIRSFEELTKFRFCEDCTPREFVTLIREAKLPINEDDFHIYSTPLDEIRVGSKQPEQVSKFGEALKGIKKGYSHSWNEKDKKLNLNSLKVTSFERAMGLFLKQGEDDKAFLPAEVGSNALLSALSNIEKEVTQCQKRNVFVDPTEYVTAEYRYLSDQYHWINFTLSEEKVLWSQNFMVIFQDYGAGMQRDYRRLQESGILDHMNKYYRNIMYLSRRNNTNRIKNDMKTNRIKNDMPAEDEEKFKPSGMSSGFQTIFIIYAGAMLVSIMVFLVEVGYETLEQKIIEFAWSMVARLQNFLVYIVLQSFNRMIAFVAFTVLMWIDEFVRFLGY